MQHFILNADLSKGQVVVHSPDLLHQLIKVLRFRSGDKCVLLDGKGVKAQATVESLNKKEARFLLNGWEPCEAVRPRILLACAISKKPSTFEWILQKATELGVAEIIPLITERGQVQELRKLERLELILKEAAEQSERCFLPILRRESTMDEVLDLGVPVLAGDARNFDLPLKECGQGSDLILVIGPEGGLTDGELDRIRAKGGQIFCLGEDILRMETAAVAALSVLRFGLPKSLGKG